MKEEETGIAGENPDYAHQNMPHTRARKCKPQSRPESSTLKQARTGKADVLTVTPGGASVI